MAASPDVDIMGQSEQTPMEIDDIDDAVSFADTMAYPTSTSVQGGNTSMLCDTFDYDYLVCVLIFGRNRTMFLYHSEEAQNTP